MNRMQKNLDGLKLSAKDFKLLLSKLDVNKSIGPNENFINTKSKLFEKCIGYEMISYI